MPLDGAFLLGYTGFMATKKVKKKPYRCFCGRTNPGGCDVQGGACVWKAKS